MEELRILFIGDIGEVPPHFFEDFIKALLEGMAAENVVESVGMEFKVEEGFAHVPTLEQIDIGIAQARQRQWRQANLFRKSNQLCGCSQTSRPPVSRMMRGGDKKRGR